MTCSKAQSLITLYIKDKLNLKELEEFIDHVNSCPDCREELEVYYALLTAMKQLDEDKTLSNNFGLELAAKLRRAQEMIIHAKYTYYRKKAILIFMLLLLAIFFNFRYSYLEQDENTIMKSNYRLRVTFHEPRNEYIDSLIQDYQIKHGMNQ
jgi:hypothetical protein